METLPPASPRSPQIVPIGSRITSARDIFRLLSPLAQGLEREHVWRIDLDARKRVLGWELVAMGTVDRVTVAPREVFRGALRSGAASAIAIVHNHLAGDPRPSRLDLQFTKRLSMCGLLLGIDIIDHVIIADEKHFSFNTARLL
jgi:DNA repair protein RadC